MDNIELTLEKNKSFVSTNKTENLHINLEREEKILPANDLQGKIDAYEQYLKEKDECDNYRLIFTIRPYCTNVLFNRITEAVFDEGSDYTKLVTKENETTNKTVFKGGALGYAEYKNITIRSTQESKHFNISPITRDTGYSSNALDNGKYLDYHCGLDIFNNHMLRKKEFVCINRENIPSLYFNTLFDKVRDPWGLTIYGFTEKDANRASSSTELHLYNRDSVYSFTEAIGKNLREENGWFGFYNYSLPKVTGAQIKIEREALPSGGNSVFNGSKSQRKIGVPTAIETPVQHDTGIDPNASSSYNNTLIGRSQKFSKIINNKEACTFIDLYPGKKEYSFIPQYNKTRKRQEKNWEYLLTYPYSNDTTHYIVHDSDFNINGILCDLDLDGKITIKQLLGLDDENPVDPPAMVLFRTHTRHTLVPGDRIRLHIYNEKNRSGNTESHVIDEVTVSSIGKNSYDLDHYFSVRLNDIITELSLEYNENGDELDVCFRFEKRVNNNNICKYYLRKFRKLPNFKDTSVNPNYDVTENDLSNTLKNYDYRTTINKLGFSKTIYGDDIAQIIYEDDINTKGLYDNLGRELTTIYLTLVKTNRGYKEWYAKTNPVYSSETIEYSHCFGKVTSGFDLPVYVDNPLECNVHRQHNIDWAIGAEYSSQVLEYSSDALDSDVYDTGGHGNATDEEKDYIFYGDLVELNEAQLEETVLENVYHRFNTAQRETDSAKFKDLAVDYIKYDDFDISTGYTGFTLGQINCDLSGGIMGNALCDKNNYANLAPEGYYYQAHYPIKLREYDTVVNVGYHTKINFTYRSGSNIIDTDKNYFIEVGQELYLFYNGEKYVRAVTGVYGNDFTEIAIGSTDSLPTMDLSKYIILKPNPIKPTTAYDFNDATGKYVWRDILPTSKVHRGSETFDSVFTNGGIYYYKDFNFYLKRQDPYGEFGLLPSPPETVDDLCISYADLEVLGDEKDVTSGDYFEPGENNIC